MKSALIALSLVSAALGQDLTAQKQKAREAAEKSAVELKLDQPYAGNENPKQMVDVSRPDPSLSRAWDKPMMSPPTAFRCVEVAR